MLHVIVRIRCCKSLSQFHKFHRSCCQKSSFSLKIVCRQFQWISGIFRFSWSIFRLRLLEHFFSDFYTHSNKLRPMSKKLISFVQLVKIASRFISPAIEHFHLTDRSVDETIAAAYHLLLSTITWCRTITKKVAGASSSLLRHAKRNRNLENVFSTVWRSHFAWRCIQSSVWSTRRSCHTPTALSAISRALTMFATRSNLSRKVTRNSQRKN